MVLDPFTALGVAGNIVQFVDFSCKLVRNSQSIAKSATGSSATTIELTAIVNDVERLSDAIDTSSSLYPSQLVNLAGQCKTLAAELLKILAQLRKKGKHSRWENFLVALNEIWKQDKINDFVQRLSLLQHQLILNMQHLVTEQQSVVLQDISKLKEESRKMNITLSGGIDRFQAAAVDELKRLWKEIQENQESAKKSAPSEASETLDLPVEIPGPSLENLCKALADLELEGRNATRNQEIFKSLYFPRFRMRHDKIEEAHEQTFQWVFKDQLRDTDSPIKFTDWLKTKSGIFWIRGKAGAGKSTLMKFICSHLKTAAYLKEWVGERELVTTNYFFWNSGSTLQKSQEGLLRTLLFDILNSSPELIPMAEQNLDELRARNSYDKSEELWTLKSLINLYKQALHHSSVKRFCIFIDGLDEYKADSDALIELIQHLAEHEHVKICVSSRPWTEFLDAFGQDKERLIKLEDLTRLDIANYTTDRLYKNAKFRRLKNLDDRYDLLVNEVVKRAQGVFLWVFLVLKSLLEGVRYADSIEDMQLRLETFPPDLEDFFRHMLNDIPPIYRRKTAQLFRIATVSEVPLSLMIYSFADDIDRDPLFAVNAKRRSMPESEVESRNEQLPLRLDGRSKGLLEVVPVSSTSIFFKFEVDFLHRTVRDFLHSCQDVQDMFDNSLPKTYDPLAILCNAHLAMLKLSPRWNDEMNDDRLLATIEGLFHFAGEVQQSSGNSDCLFQTLDEAKSVLQSPGLTRLQWESEPDAEFLAMTVQAGLVNYFEHAFGSLRRKSKRPYLWYALLLPWKKKNFNGTWQLSSLMVCYLLNHGEALNIRTDSQSAGTIWTEFLARVAENPELHTDNVFEVLKILVINGRAFLDALVPEKHKRAKSERSESNFNRIGAAVNPGDLHYGVPGIPEHSDQTIIAGAPTSTYLPFSSMSQDPSLPSSTCTDYTKPKRPLPSSRRLILPPTAQDVIHRIAPKSVIDFILANTTGSRSVKKRASDAFETNGDHCDMSSQPPKKQNNKCRN